MPGGEQTLRVLEQQVDELIALCTRLREENRALRMKHATLLSDKAKLVERNEVAKTRLESMILRLRSMEHNA